MKPDNFRILVIDRKLDPLEVLIGGSAQTIEAGEGCTKELVSRPNGFSACLRVVADAFASATEMDIGFIAQSAQIRRVKTHHLYTLRIEDCGLNERAYDMDNVVKVGRWKTALYNLPAHPPAL